MFNTIIKFNLLIFKLAVFLICLFGPHEKEMPSLMRCPYRNLFGDDYLRRRMQQVCGSLKSRVLNELNRRFELKQVTVKGIVKGLVKG